MNGKKILTIAGKNQFPLHLITKLKTQIQQKQQETKTKNQRKKWATFTYHSAKVRTITNLFKHTSIKIAFRTSNTIQQRNKTRNNDTTHDLRKSGIYKMA
jgi:effector-binding domain-containing protein